MCECKCVNINVVYRPTDLQTFVTSTENVYIYIIMKNF